MQMPNSEKRLPAPSRGELRLAVADGLAEIALEDPPHPVRVLQRQRPIQAQVAAERLLHARVHRLRHHRVDGIAGREVDQHEHARGDEEQHRDGGDHPVQDQLPHGARPRPT